jgi:hypothetical protein
MGLLQKHAILTAVGLVLSILAVAWLQPNSTGGTTLVVVFLLIVVNAVGAIIIRTGPTAGG